MPNHVHLVVVIRRPADIVATTVNPVGAIHELPLQDSTQHEIPPNKLSDEYRKIRRVMTIPKIIGYYRMNAAKRINEFRNTPGIPVWQRNYFEHIIRDAKSRFVINKYIRENPTMWHKDSKNHLDGELRDFNQQPD
jgi:putative transposase